MAVRRSGLRHMPRRGVRGVGRSRYSGPWPVFPSVSPPSVKTYSTKVNFKSRLKFTKVKYLREKNSRHTTEKHADRRKTSARTATGVRTAVVAGMARMPYGWRSEKDTGQGKALGTGRGGHHARGTRGPGSGTWTVHDAGNTGSVGGRERGVREDWMSRGDGPRQQGCGDPDTAGREVSTSEASAGGRAGHEKRREACGMGAVRGGSVGDGSGERCGADRCAGGCVTAAAGRQKERSFPEQSPPAAFGGVPDASRPDGHQRQRAQQ